MRYEPPFGKEYLQDRITAEFALARHLAIRVERADDDAIVLCAPLMPNANHQGTAFGGSLFCVAVLTGWAWMTRFLELSEVAADAVIQESTMKYLVPVLGPLRASLAAPEEARIEKLRKMLRRAGRGRILLNVAIHQDRALATDFEGVYAASLR